LIPLACRARESARPDALLCDPLAVELFANFDSQMECLRGITAEDYIFILMRARRFDEYARVFLASCPTALVVDIGCGLDTRFARLDAPQSAWLGLDLPEVIELRRRFLPDRPSAETLGCSMFDLSWLDAVAQAGRPVIFLAEGVFPYFTEGQIKGLVIEMIRRFPGAELAFDALSPFSVKLHNRKSQILKDTGARLNWAVADSKDLEAWGMRLLDEWGYFDQREPRLGAAYLMRYIPAMAKMNMIYHYRLADKGAAA
jgi:O-methyltransferase involved in polyketide biosynthesis